MNSSTGKNKYTKYREVDLSRITGVIYRASHALGTASLLTLYHSLFLPIMGYCCDIWENACATNLHCITLSVTKKAVRLVFGASRLDHTSMLFYRCRVLRFKAKLLEISSDTHQLHYIPKHHFII